MSDQQQHQQRVDYFNARYWKIAHYWFKTADRTLLRDHLADADRTCRFCNRGVAELEFRELAHAVPDFLGNLSIISMNECDVCNAYFGNGCEDHLSKATMLMRTLAGIPRKKRPKSTFKSNDESLRIDACGHRVDMRVPTPNSVDELMVDGGLPDTIPLLGDTRSQPYIPIQAAMALVKIACSVCPKEELEQSRDAIEWVRGRKQQAFGTFPVLFAFTPGTFDERVSQIVLLRRKDEGPEPYLWCVVQFRNFRFQVFVPFCSADTHLLENADVISTKFEHYPSMFPSDWPKGPTEFHWFNWAGTEKVRTSWNVAHHLERLDSVIRPSCDPPKNPDTKD